MFFFLSWAALMLVSTSNGTVDDDYVWTVPSHQDVRRYGATVGCLMAGNVDVQHVLGLVKNLREVVEEVIVPPCPPAMVEGNLTIREKVS